MEKGMELNPKKCKEMIITFLKYNHTCFSPIYVGGVPIELVSTFKLLGVQLTNDVTWNVHVDYIIKKANSRLYSLRKLRKAGLKNPIWPWYIVPLFVRYWSMHRHRGLPCHPHCQMKLNLFSAVLLKLFIRRCHMLMHTGRYRTWYLDKS